MTTYEQTIRQVEAVHQLAVGVFAKVVEKAEAINANPLVWWQRDEAMGYVRNAEANVATISKVPGILNDALAAGEQEAPDIFAQAMVIVEQTEEATVRYATWAEQGPILAVIRAAWAQLKELLSDLAYEVADAVVVIGKGAAEAVGGPALLLGAGGLLALLYFARRR